MPQNEVEQFLKDTEQDPNKVDVLEQPIVSSQEENVGASDSIEHEHAEERPKNRRERRLMERLQAERESSMFLAGKLEARTEAERAISEEADYLKSIERIYGTETPEAQLATDLLKKAIVGAIEDARETTLQELRREAQAEAADEEAADQELDSMIDEIEDEYGVSLTDTQERAFFVLLERMSPKDRSGNVIEYADPHAVWDVLQERMKGGTVVTTNRAKDFSSRSMIQSGASKESNLQDDVMTRFLKDQGII